MNTDMNPESVNPDDSNDLNTEIEETQLMDTPDNPIAADVTAELPVAKDLEDAVAPDPDAATDDSQTPKRPSGLKRKFVAGGSGSPQRSMAAPQASSSKISTSSPAVC